MKQYPSRTKQSRSATKKSPIKYSTSKKCNLRCPQCHKRGGMSLLPHSHISQYNTTEKHYNEERKNIVIDDKTNLIKVPQHIGFILDGNRRWAKQQNKTSNFGHKQGAKNIKNLCNLCIKYGVKYLTLYCLSVENLDRSKQELKFLFACIKQFLQKKNIRELHEDGINLSIIGDFTLLPKDVASAIEYANKLKNKNTIKLNLQACICYSGRNEILNGAKKIVKDFANNTVTLKQVDEMNEKTFEKYISTGHLPDVDLLIRTGGDLRISNFLLWKISYAELHFCNIAFPAFNEENFLLALYDFQNRHRRYGV